MDASDIIHVHQLIGLYGHIVDAAAWHRFDELFTPYTVLDYTAVRAPQVFHGVEEIRQWFSTANHPSAHHVTNVVVWEEEGGRVRAHSKFLAPYTRPTHVPHRWFGGDYDDVVVRTPEGWRFSQRTCTGRWQFTEGPEDEIAEHRRTF